jgi:hypothetical protein
MSDGSTNDLLSGAGGRPPAVRSVRFASWATIGRVGCDEDVAVGGVTDREALDTRVWPNEVACAAVRDGAVKPKSSNPLDSLSSDACNGPEASTRPPAFAALSGHVDVYASRSSVGVPIATRLILDVRPDSLRAWATGPIARTSGWRSLSLRFPLAWTSALGSQWSTYCASV